MKSGFICTSILFSACLTNASFAAETESSDPEWLGDYAQAKSMARKTDKPLFVVFR